MKSGFVAIVGRPNVGKSTFLNNLLGSKVAIISDKPGTTRHFVHGVYHEENYQIVFVDTPGIHKPKHELGELMNRTALQSLRDADVILFLVDASDSLGKGDQRIIATLKQQNKPVILGLNKIDKISKEKILLKITEYQQEYDFAEIIPISGLNQENTDRLVAILKNYINDEVPYYPPEQVTNRSLEFMIAEIIREKVLTLTAEEVPHSITCLIENMRKTKHKTIIDALIIVDRAALKKIILGRKGAMIKQIGTLARQEIEAMLNDQVYLQLYVKVLPKWREKKGRLRELGYGED